MSYTSQALAMDHILRDIHKIDGLISREPQGSDHPVFPHRDKRKRPVIWIEQAGFQWLRGLKMIAPHMRGFVLSDAVAERIENGEGAVVDPSDAVYIPDVSRVAANANLHSTPLDRLARRPGLERGKKWLSAAEVEAGYALIRDYARLAFCCRQDELEAVERQERWAAGSGKQIVKLGLARLAELYGTAPG